MADPREAQMSEALRLERMERRHADALVDMAQEFREQGDPRMDAVLDDLEGYFAAAARFEAGRDLGPDLVQQTHFLMFAGARLRGGSRLRHRLNDKLRLDGGNIGYEIRPSCRGQGNGSAILRLTLLEARRIPLERVLLTAAIDNTASRRVIERHGGVRDGTSISPDTGEEMALYWIPILDASAR